MAWTERSTMLHTDQTEIAVTNPATSEEVDRVPGAGAAEADAAVAEARRYFPTGE